MERWSNQPVDFIVLEIKANHQHGAGIRSFFPRNFSANQVWHSMPQREPLQKSFTTRVTQEDHCFAAES